MTDLGARLRATLESERARLSAAHKALSFDEYLQLFAAQPKRHTRDAARWMRAMFEHYGSREVDRPWGKITRWKLFDLPWEDESGQREGLIAHEELQGEVYRVLSNFAEQGRVDRLVLLHGPNGSAKSTFCATLMRAMEDYSHTDEGALYRFSWVFPKGKGGGELRIGFGTSGGKDDGPKPGESYAHLDEAAIDAKIHCELRDHPLLLLPLEARRSVLRDALAPEERVPDALWKGGLSHKSQQVFEALLSAYRGDLSKVLAHVQVERWFVSRKYRVGAVTLGPQMAVDAHERQVTASRSLASLPASLQNVALFEPFGELVDAAGGLIEYSDLLKRPLDAWKYLLLMIETGEVALNTSNLSPNLVMIGSANELHLDAFREHPEFASFRGRLELLRAPYLLDWTAEKSIYDRQVVPSVRRHVAPHATEMAALFAVLSRMRKPSADRYPKEVATLAADLSPLEKADLYANGTIPSRVDRDQSKVLRGNIEALFRESDVYPNYEGRMGASPREVRALLLEAAQSPSFSCLSPFAVLEECATLITRKNEFDWLRQDPLAGGYHDPRYFLRVLRERLLDHMESSLRDATGLVDEARYFETFERYVSHVRAFVKGEKVVNKVTRRDENPDEVMMREIERVLGATGTPADFRGDLISMVAGWAIDHPGQPVDYVGLFPRHLTKLKESFFAERKARVASMAKELLVLLTDSSGLDAESLARAEKTRHNLVSRFGYCDRCARDMASALLKERYH
ncbi:MAG: serine protein kinase PrkA [Myxococcales bacterium]|nr:serine protein kinase PrkA [Myxococcales bacterium]